MIAMRFFHVYDHKSKEISIEKSKMTKEQIQMQSIMKINPMGEGKKE